MSPVNDQNNIFLATILRKLVDRSMLVNQPKIRSNLADLYSIYVGGRQAFTVKRIQLWLLRLRGKCELRGPTTE